MIGKLRSAPYDVNGLAASFQETTRVLTDASKLGKVIDRKLDFQEGRIWEGFTNWTIPPGYLCPPLPGRADYIHHVADLLAEDHQCTVPRGEHVAILDIGIGANAVYPIIGHREYGWRFVGSDLDPVALESAARNIAGLPGLAGRIELRRQSSPSRIFRGVVRPGEQFAASVCNPPFHASAAAALAGARRKRRNLAGTAPKAAALVSNFGGQGAELWCPGGELAFVRRMIAESAEQPALCRWFTSLVSSRENLPAILHALRMVRAVDVRTIAMAQGQKKSRLVAWSFRGRSARPRETSEGGKRAGRDRCARRAGS